MFFMSASDSCEANACITALARLPFLNSCNCLTRYSGCCWASLGLAGVPELPSAPWQAAHTAVNLALPWLRSGLAGAAAGAAGGAAFSSLAKEDNAGTARTAAISRIASGFISGGICSSLLAQNLVILQCRTRGFPANPKAPHDFRPGPTRRNQDRRRPGHG